MRSVSSRSFVHLAGIEAGRQIGELMDHDVRASCRYSTREPGSIKDIEHGRFEQPKRSGKDCWPHPIIANGRLYIRDQQYLFCYDIKAE